MGRGRMDGDTNETFRVGRHHVPSRPWVSRKVRARTSSRNGQGLFAAEPIGAGEVVVVWGGAQYVGPAQAARAKAEGLGTMQWDDDLFSCEGGEDDVAFRINHSCDPNLWMKDTFTLTARRDISRGEELGIDYAMLGGDENYRSEWDCRCGAPDCRHRITGLDWKEHRLRERYAGHFIPFVNRKIARLHGT